VDCYETLTERRNLTHLSNYKQQENKMCVLPAVCVPQRGFILWTDICNDVYIQLNINA
jgi:hypothetical protein